MITYDNLWRVMKEKGVSQYALIKRYGISPAQITRLKRNESVSTHTIDMFCRILRCQVGDICSMSKPRASNKPPGRRLRAAEKARPNGRRFQFVLEYSLKP